MSPSLRFTHILRNVRTLDQVKKAKIKYTTVFFLLLKYLAHKSAEMGTENKPAAIKRPENPYFPLNSINFLLPGVTTNFFFLDVKKVTLDFKPESHAKIAVPP